MVTKNGHEMLLGQITSSIEYLKDQFKAGAQRMTGMDEKVSQNRKDADLRFKKLEEFMWKIVGGTVAVASLISVVLFILSKSMGG